MAKRGQKPKLWNLVQIAGYLDFEDPEFYSWIVEARARDIEIRSTFTDGEWAEILGYVGQIIAEPDGPGSKLIFPSTPPANWPSIRTKLMQVSLVSPDSPPAAEAIEWGPFCGYLQWLDWSAVPLRPDCAPKLTAFGTRKDEFLRELLPFGPDNTDALIGLLKSQKIIESAPGLYEVSSVKGLAKFRERGRPAALSPLPIGDPKRFDIRRADFVASHMIAEEPGNIVELLDKQDVITREHRYLTECRKKTRKLVRDRSAAGHDPNFTSSPSQMARISAKIDEITKELQINSKAEQDWENSLARLFDEMRALRDVADPKLANFHTAWFGSAQKNLTSAKTNSRYDTLLWPAFGIAFRKLRDRDVMRSDDELWSALAMVGGSDLTPEQRKWRQDYKEKYDSYVERRCVEVADRLDRWQRAFWGRGRVNSPHMPSRDDLLAFIDELLPTPLSVNS